SYPLPKFGSLAPDSVGITITPDGNIWYTDRGDNLIGKINPNNPSDIQTYGLDGSINYKPSTIIYAAGKLWFTEENTPQIGEFDPSHPGAGATQVPLNSTGLMNMGIALGSDGNLWVGAIATQAGHVGALIRVSPTNTTPPTQFPVSGLGAFSVTS